ncbi:unnamed protein product [Cladocopium goreaui]|uniref:Mitochondrial substrate carrier family protein n=1 Tax=Cladocopium goreaui TaxID=2562237 RepID=A0A9P1FG06_9DINO|nr:unnamed protein product [Cladocopium goreaui]|mmetsp:Transcript_23404/g.50943  ORF Transcript_23404/g.50943 Transcript_23404/m.50943 type:complete len:295 (+) Transcript_23404:53-937(+)
MTDAATLQAKRFSCSVSAGLVAGFLTNPTETIRVRWQVLSMTSPSATETGLLQFSRQILKSEGLIRGLWLPGCTGWMAAFGGAFGVRMGIYESVRCGVESTTGLSRSPTTAFMAGLCTGSLANAVCCPFFQAKNRLQAQGSSGPQRSLFRELVSITQENGFTGLYRGVPALFMRGGLIAGGQLFGYDTTKRFMVSQGVQEGPVVHLASSSVSAVSAVLASAPADVVLNRYQAGPRLGKHYSSLLDVASELARTEGPLAFYKGVVPNVVKFLPLFLMSMPLFEQLRRLMGLGYLN